MSFKKDFIDIGKSGGEFGRGDFQIGWHYYAGKMFTGKSILDVGAGLGHSRERLSVNGNTVTLQDVAPGMPVDIKNEIESIPDNSYDVITCFDVIEHIVEDITFLAQLIRLSRLAVFITTPNYNISKNANPCHVREYTPEQLVELASTVNASSTFLSGSSDGKEIRKYWTVLEKINFLTHNDPHHGFILYPKEKE